MQLKNNFTVLVLLFTFCPFHFQLKAQTNVIKTNALKNNQYGVRYILPKTVLEIEVEYTETKQKAGIYAKYASKFLGLEEQSLILEDISYYTLDKVNVVDFGFPNKENTYLIEFKAKTTAPFVYLTEDGLICTINADYTYPTEGENKSKPANATAAISPLSPQSVFTEEYLRAGSAGKMAEIAAKQIYRIRESRSDILTGEAENAPKDGEALKIVLANLDAQEKVWMDLFTGTGRTEKKTGKYRVEPVADLEKEILFRFSKYRSIVNADDLSGSPVYINIKDLKTVETPEIDPKQKAKEPQSIVYNVPGSASVEIYYGINRLYKGEHPVTQFGTTQILATSLFEDKKAPVQIIFYPRTGGIRQIIQ
ncbi:MAG: DUF4831 family protein [Candidatus Symbiothrix sp.]|jgi:hypothetical protein|nr:DUF4831 family protein [Candidatus Symbiothrix sp.]